MLYLLFVAWESERVDPALFDEEICEIAVYDDTLEVMLDLDIRVKDKLLFLRMELNAIKWVCLRLHSCNKGFSLVIVAYCCWDEYRSQAIVSVELFRSYAIMMMVISQFLCLEDLSALSQGTKKLSLCWIISEM